MVLFPHTIYSLSSFILQMKEMKIEEHGAVYKVQNNTNRRQDYRQRPALGRNLQLSNAACSYCGFHHEGRKTVD
jgi:ethanolamine ammonia-lyase small subunit